MGSSVTKEVQSLQLKDVRFRGQLSCVRVPNIIYRQNRDGDIYYSGRKHVTSDSHGFEHIDPQSRVLNYCFQ